MNKANFNNIFSIWEDRVFYLILAILIYLAAFWQLDYLSIQPWDESLFAIRAYFFAENGFAIQNFNQLNGLEHYSNSKPVFMTAIQALFFKIFGFNELSLRLPNALIFSVFCFGLVSISKKVFHNKYIGFLAALILLTSPGLFQDHMLRFGDQDIAFAIFSFMMVYCFYLFTESNSWKHILLSLMFFLFAYFTKSVAIFLCFPALFIYLWSNKKLTSILQNKKIWLLALAMCSAVLLSLLENVNHLNNYKRLTSVVEHKGGFLYYFYDFVSIGNLIPWILLLPLSILYFKKNKFLQLLLLQSLSIFIILSLAQTKLYWYASPIYIFLAPVFAYIIYDLIKKIVGGFQLNAFNKKLLIFTLVFVLFAYPYKQTIEKIYFPTDKNEVNHLGFVLNRAKIKFPELKKIKLIVPVSSTYKPQLEYYPLLYNEQFGYQIIKTEKTELMMQNDVVLCNDETVLEFIDTHFERDTLLFFHNTFLFKLKNEL